MSIELTPLAVQNRELFAHLQAHGAPDTIADLAAALRRDPSNFRKTLMALEAEGWIGRDDKGVALAVQGERALLAMDIAAGRSSVGPPPLTHDQISPDPDQPREDFESLDAKTFIGELAKSIAERGLLQPIRVRMTSADTAMIEVGESRWRAIGLLIEWGDDRWPADRPIPYTLAEAEAATDILLDQLVENVQRRGLHPLEEAAGYRRLRDAGISVVDIATKVGKDRRTIEQRLDLLNLPADLAEQMRLPKDDPRRVTTARARELLQHLRRINEQAEQLDIEEIAPGGVASPEDQEAARRVRLDPLELLTLGEIAAAVAERPSTRFPHSPSAVVEVHRDQAVSSDRLTKLTLGRFASLVIDKDQEGEPAGVRMEPLGHVRLRLDNAHPADNSRALFHLRREAGLSADQARNLATLGRYVSTWLNPAAPEPAPQQDPAEGRQGRIREGLGRANPKQMVVIVEVADRIQWSGDAEVCHGGRYYKLGINPNTEDWAGAKKFMVHNCGVGFSYLGGQEQILFPSEILDYLVEQGLLSPRDGPRPPLHERWAILERAWSDAYAKDRVRKIFDSGEYATPWLNAASASPAPHLALPAPPLNGSDEGGRETQELFSPTAKAVDTVSDVQLRILLELQAAQLDAGGGPAPVGKFWLDLDAVGLWKSAPPLILFAAPPGEAWGASVTEAGTALIAAEQLGDREAFVATTLARIAEEGPVSAWLRDPTPAQLPDVSTSDIIGAIARGDEEEAENEALLAQVREQLATGRPDFPALMRAVGLGGTIRATDDAEIQVTPVGGGQVTSVCTIDQWHELDDDKATARTELVEWALCLAAGQVQLALPEGDDTPDRALYRAARAMQDFLTRAIPPATPLFMEVAEPYERLSVALNQAIWAADHPKPREEPQARPEPLLAIHAGDVLHKGTEATAYRILARAPDKARQYGPSTEPAFTAQTLRNGKDYGAPVTIGFSDLVGFVNVKAEG